MGLLEEGYLRPTSAEVAERAGVSLRSVFQHFEDMESLYAAVADAQMERLGHFVSQEVAEGPMGSRMAAFVVVVASPWYAQASADGRWSIPGVPAGT